MLIQEHVVLGEIRFSSPVSHKMIFKYLIQRSKLCSSYCGGQNI